MQIKDIQISSKKAALLSFILWLCGEIKTPNKNVVYGKEGKQRNQQKNSMENTSGY